MTTYPEIVEDLQAQIEVLHEKNGNLCALVLETYTKFCASEHERKVLEEQMVVIESVLVALDTHDRSIFMGPDADKNRRQGIVRSARKLMRGRLDES